MTYYILFSPLHPDPYIPVIMLPYDDCRTLSQAASMIGISPKTASRMVHENRHCITPDSTAYIITKHPGPMIYHSQVPDPEYEYTHGIPQDLINIRMQICNRVLPLYDAELSACKARDGALPAGLHIEEPDPIQERTTCV